MGMTVSGSTALVTGATSGIGAATAEALAAAGCRLTLVGRDEARLAAVAARTDGHPVLANLATTAGIQRAAEAGQDADLLINNAGIGWMGALDAMASDDLSHLVSVNLTAPMELTRAVVPMMLRRRRGHVVFVSSVAAIGVRHEAVYAATKAGLRTFAASVRYETAGHGVGVSTVLPGAVRTPFFHTRGKPYDRRFPHPVRPEAVADALLRAVERGQFEVFVPRWLTIPARLQGALPEAFHRLSRRFGQ